MSRTDLATIGPLRMQDQGSDPSSPPAGYKYVYAKSGGLYLKESSGAVGLLGGSAFASEVTAPDFAPTGLSGATAASRYVGGTTSGAPASGTFAVGDFVVDRTGKVWVCTTAGTPGLWTQAGGTSALTKIAETILGADAASITFSSIPGTYRNLLLMLTGRHSVAATTGNVYLQYNGDTAANYDASELYNAGSVGWANSIAQATPRVGLLTGATGPASFAGALTATIFDYARTQWYKHAVCTTEVVAATTNGNYWNLLISHDWRSTAAITSVLVGASGGNLLTGTVCTLYGVG